MNKCPGTVAHAGNLYPGRDQEDCSSRPAWAKSSQEPSQPIKSWVWSCVPVIPAVQDG
jgi:hypothetical protein